MFRRVGVVLAVALTPCLALAAPGQASARDTYECAFSLVPGAFVPPVPLVGPGVGGYAFAGPATCVHVDADGAIKLPPDVVTNDTGVYAAAIAVTGAYASVTCSTFTMTGGPASITITIPGDTESPVISPHTATIVEGAGSVVGVFGSDLDVSAGPGAGFFNIAPPPATPPPGCPLGAATLSGALSFHLV